MEPLQLAAAAVNTDLRPLLAAMIVLAGPAAAQSAPPAVVPPAPAVQPAAQPIPAGRWTVAQLRQAFDLADTDSDGRLNRAEAQRLAIMPRSFEDMDQNKDGVLERGEYEASATK